MHKIYITRVDAMGRQITIWDTFAPTDKTPNIAAHDLINSLVLQDGDTLAISFSTHVVDNEDEADVPTDTDTFLDRE